MFIGEYTILTNRISLNHVEIHPFIHSYIHTIHNFGNSVRRSLPIRCLKYLASMNVRIFMLGIQLLNHYIYFKFYSFLWKLQSFKYPVTLKHVFFIFKYRFRRSKKNSDNVHVLFNILSYLAKTVGQTDVVRYLTSQIVTFIDLQCIFTVDERLTDITK